MTLEQKVKAVDDFLAPRWFKTVTRKTWVNGNFVATDYSVDEARGRIAADRANEPPLPVLVRYLCEFHASDLKPDLASLKPPLLMLQPAFTEALRADKMRNYLAGYLKEPWGDGFPGRPHTEVKYLEGAGILVMDDAAEEVDRAMEAFLKKETR
jgi:hypothetical protein